MGPRNRARRTIRSSVGPAFVTGTYAIFFLSGVSGLIYQVIWVRWFGRVFGNTVFSASLVIAVFMCGLGVGSYLAGRWIDRRSDREPGFALRVYGALELAIGALGVVIAFVLPALEPLAARISAYTIGADGWYELSASSYAARYALAVLVLAPSSLLMGATLTVLIRSLLQTDLALAGWRVGFLYGFNTGGAAAGAFLSDFALIPNLGLFASHLIAAALNLAAAAGALYVARFMPVAAARAGAQVPAPSAPEPPGRLSAPVAFAGLALFATGFCAMGTEILWFRYFSIHLGAFRSVFSLLLTVILCGIWLGSIASGVLHRRFGRPGLLYMTAQAGFVAATLLLLVFVRTGRGNVELPGDPYGTSFAYDLAATWALLRPIALVAGLPALLMGFAFPLANAIVQDTQLRIGRRAGWLYLANTVGAVLGSLGAGFLLLPWLGLKAAAAALAAIGGGAVLLMWASARRIQSPRARDAGVSAACAVAVALVLAVWARQPPDLLYRAGLSPGDAVLAVSEGVNELVTVVECDGCDGRILRTNGHNMSGTTRLAQRYMRAFAHVPLLHLRDPSDVLVIGFGVGTTLHAASLHPSVRRLDVADLSRNVLAHARYFEDTNHGVLRDPRVRVFVTDGRQHLWTRNEGAYDLITLEPPPIGFAGVSALYSREFYALARSRLRAGGFMTQWLPGYQMPEPVVRAMVRAFVDVFPNAILLAGERQELILLGARAPTVTIDPDDLRAELERRPQVGADLERVALGTPVDILGMFVAGSATLVEATRATAPVTDDRPLMEYAATAVNCARTRFPRDVVDLGGLDAWCPRCFVGGRVAPSVADLQGYRTVMNGYFQSVFFLEDGGCEGPPTAEVLLPIPPSSPLFERYPYLTIVLSPL